MVNLELVCIKTIKEVFVNFSKLLFVDRLESFFQLLLKLFVLWILLFISSSRNWILFCLCTVCQFVWLCLLSPYLYITIRDKPLISYLLPYNLFCHIFAMWLTSCALNWNWHGDRKNHINVELLFDEKVTWI